MAKQVSKTVIGGFVISAIALLVIGIVVFGGGKFFKKTFKYVLFFDRSVKGLNAGAPVVFRGVEIGSVYSVAIRANPENLEIDIPVIIEVEPDRFQTTGTGGDELARYKRDPYQRAKQLIEHGLRARMTIESIVTGQLMIEIDFFPDTPVKLTGLDAGYPELPTIPTSIEQFAETLKKVPLEEIFEKLLSAISNLEKIMGAPELMDTVKNLEAATENANQLIQSADTLAQNINQQVQPLSENLQGAVGDARKLLQNADGQIQPVSAKLQDALVSARRALDGARTTLVNIDTFAAERSAFRIKLDASLEEIAAASRSVRALTEYLERHPEALLQGKSGS
jgi:paraquat-inducible protein B